MLLITGVDVVARRARAGGRRAGAAGGVFGGVYIVTGGFARRELSTLAYTAICYGDLRRRCCSSCACSTGSALAGYAAADWVRIAALTVFGQLLGHSLFNFVLRSISPTIVALATLFTVPLARRSSRRSRWARRRRWRRSRRSHCCSPGPRS